MIEKSKFGWTIDPFPDTDWAPWITLNFFSVALPFSMTFWRDHFQFDIGPFSILWIPPWKREKKNPIYEGWEG